MSGAAPGAPALPCLGPRLTVRVHAHHQVVAHGASLAQLVGVAVVHHVVAVGHGADCRTRGPQPERLPVPSDSPGPQPAARAQAFCLTVYAEAAGLLPGRSRRPSAAPGSSGRRTWAGSAAPDAAPRGQSAEGSRPRVGSLSRPEPVALTSRRTTPARGACPPCPAARPSPEPRARSESWPVGRHGPASSGPVRRRRTAHARQPSRGPHPPRGANARTDSPEPRPFDLRQGQWRAQASWNPAPPSEALPSAHHMDQWGAQPARSPAPAGAAIATSRTEQAL